MITGSLGGDRGGTLVLDRRRPAPTAPSTLVTTDPPDHAPGAPAMTPPHGTDGVRPAAASGAAPAEGREVERHEVVIVGAGFSGLGAAIQLQRAGVHDLVLLDRGDTVGGTWRDNTYPGATCDVPSHVYSFSFAPNPDWTRSFSPQSEILAYLERTARSFGVLPRCRFRHTVTGAHWDETEARWLVDTDRGTRFSARFLVAAAGPLSEPVIPRLPGLDTFPGTAFHSARWDHGHQLAGERVAIVGTGASAIQFAPHVQRAADHLTIFQRTPAWIVPRADRELTSLERRAFRRFPFAQRFARTVDYWLREAYVLGFARDLRLLELAERAARQHLEEQVLDPELRRQLTPDYVLGCKRVLISNDFYPTLNEPNVDLVAAGVREVRGSTLVAADGTEVEVDTIIFGTGFQVTRPPIAGIVHGPGGTLSDAWKSGMRAFLGTQVHGFPNLFVLVGPNTGLGHNSIVFMAEAQIRYVVDAVRTMDAAAIPAVDVRAEVQQAWDDEVQRDLVGTVWTSGGCSSWYLDESGRNSTLWPGFTWQFRRRTARFDLAEHHRVDPLAVRDECGARDASGARDTSGARCASGARGEPAA
jgi:cation diffusion facilitator CzcD-associated flavoprotein CzcO